MCWLTLPACLAAVLHHHPLQVLDPEQSHVYKSMTLGQYLDSRGYSESFKYNYVLPMCAAVWSVPNATVIITMGCNKTCILLSCNLVKHSVHGLVTAGGRLGRAPDGSCCQPYTMLVSSVPAGQPVTCCMCCE